MNYKTTDFLTAAVLIYSGIIMDKIDKTSKRFVFEFESSDELRLILDNLKTRKMLVEPSRFFYVGRDLKRLIHEE